MVKRIQRFQNFNDTATISSGITLNITTSATVQALNTGRTFFRIDNPSNKNIWLKLQAASVDNDAKGIFVAKGDSWEMPMDNIYTGEISALADVDAPVVYTTEY